jgi:hypothetical protein
MMVLAVDDAEMVPDLNFDPPQDDDAGLPEDEQDHAQHGQDDVQDQGAKMVLDLSFDPPQEDDAGLPEDEQDHAQHGQDQGAKMVLDLKGGEH